MNKFLRYSFIALLALVCNVTSVRDKGKGLEIW